MNLLILSRGPQLYSTKSLYHAAEERGHHVRIIDHGLCNLVLENNNPQVYYGAKRLEAIDAIIPRIGASFTEVGAAVIQQFEAKKVFSLMGSTALIKARNKLRTMQILASKKIPIPKTAFIRFTDEINSTIEKLGGTPIVIKLLESTHGVGVILAENIITIQSVLETLQKIGTGVLLQEFIQESSGKDVRAFVVGNEVVAAMERTAKAGEFRSNLHRGANAKPVSLTEEEKLMVKKAVQYLGLEVAGVDFLRSDNGPLLLEVNPSPGLEGIETYTEIDVAGKIILHLERKVKKFKSEMYNQSRRRFS